MKTEIGYVLFFMNGNLPLPFTRFSGRGKKDYLFILQNYI